MEDRGEESCESIVYVGVFIERILISLRILIDAYDFSWRQIMIKY